MGLDFDQLFPGRFLKAGDFLGRDVTLTISEVKIEELEGDKGKQVKGLLSFVGKKKQLVLNKTNGICIREMFGRDTGLWVGKRVTLYPQAVDYEDAEIAIRVRGSPDIAAPITFILKLSRKKPRSVTLQKTAARAAATPNPAPSPAAAPAPAAPKPQVLNEAQLPSVPPGVDDAGAPWNDGADGADSIE